MPHKLYAIFFNNQECLLHIDYNERQIDVRFLSEEMTKVLQINRIVLSRDGALLSPPFLRSDALDLEAIKDLHGALLESDATLALPKPGNKLSAA